MATYQGTSGSVKLKAGSSGTLTAVADVRSWSVTVTRDTVEDTAMGQDYRTFKKGLSSWSGSMEIVYNDTSDAEVSSALSPEQDEAVTVEFYVDETNAATSKFAGEVIVTSFAITDTYDGLVTATVDFTGNGAPTAAKFGG